MAAGRTPEEQREYDRLRQLRWRQENREKARAAARRSAEKNRESRKERARAAYAADPAKHIARQKRYYEENKGKIKVRRQSEKGREQARLKAARWRERNPEKAREAQRKNYAKRGPVQMAAWRAANPEKARATYRRAYENGGRERSLAWKRANPDRVRATSQKTYVRMKEDPQLRLAYLMRSRLHAALRGAQKPARTFDLIGCSRTELVAWLEAKFQPGMSWANYGEWHIDHKLPISKFDLTHESSLRAACHYTNLQPMWAADNLSKGAKVV